MFLTVHAAAAVVIAEKTDQWWLAFILGFLSHLILDMIPHGDEDLAKLPRPARLKKLTLIGLLDLGLAALLIYQLINNNLIAFSPVLGAALAGAFFPDFIWSWHELTAWKILGQIHEKLGRIFVHSLNIKIPLSKGLAVQIITLTLLIYWLTLIIA